ncbi:MAG: 6-hydroxymethylpterin diphosphokinase MptE-like protein [Candidatus Hodarchaeales archaeon]|jgi:uncharacterized Rossmann fold enzyme
MTDIEDIARRVGFDHSKDLLAAETLREMLSSSKLSAEVNEALVHLRTRIQNKLVFVTGAATNLNKDYENIHNVSMERRDFIEFIAADGTCKYLLERGRVPIAVMTDLDGGMDNILAAGRAGSTIVMLAHGDNMQLIKGFINQLKRSENENIDIIPTVQVPNPDPPLYNLGGFTDGDRCVQFAKYHAFRIVLLGFDFHGRIGPYSKPTIPEGGLLASRRKKLKLQVAKEIINEAAEHYPDKIWTINAASRTEHVKLITTLEIDQFASDFTNQHWS